MKILKMQKRNGFVMKTVPFRVRYVLMLKNVDVFAV